jgi:hypothetical protein
MKLFLLIILFFSLFFLRAVPGAAGHGGIFQVCHQALPVNTFPTPVACREKSPGEGRVADPRSLAGFSKVLPRLSWLRRKEKNTP